jgi:predicted ATPase/DNA-binding winged helix-turn-helix (wHTH) protein
MVGGGIRPVYASGECVIDLARRELRVHGSPVPVGGRAFEVIEVLARSAGELVTKDELMDRIWPGAVVMENTLQVHAVAIRKALGPYRGLLKTESRRGYRLLGDWTVRHHDAAMPPVGLQKMRVAGESPVTNFPVVVTRLVGRSGAAQQLRDLVSAYRIVTLTGPGGIGKTTLAVKVARRILAEFNDGGWLVELAPLSDPALVPSAVAHVLGLKLGGEAISAEAVARTVGAQNLLLVLDNCEHVVDAVATLAEILVRLCPRVTILATSREIFRIGGEYVYRVPPLDVPAPGKAEPDHILGHSAVELFIATANALGSNFPSHAENLSAIATICRHLDGIPLAIEFAAARAAALGIEQVAVGLRDRFALLTTGRRTAVPRHRTLRATLDWSYELLPEPERCLLRRLAVFPAGFTLEAATGVMRDAGQGESAVIESIVNLVAKSLVASDGSVSAGRWRLLETIRAYALVKLTESGEAARAARSHAEFFRDLVALAAPASRSDPTLSNLNLCIREIDNVRAALDWGFSSAGDSETGVVLTAAYVPVWLHFSLITECRERTERALAAFGPDANLGAPASMQLHSGLGTAMLHTMGAIDRIATLLTKTLQLAEDLDDIDAQLQTLWGLWLLHHDTGDCRAARTITERFASVAHHAGDPAGMLVADRLAGYTIQFGGDLAAAQHYIERVLDLYRAPMDLRRRVWFLHDQRVAAHDLLARSLWLQGFVDQAAEHARACLEEAEASDNSLSICEAIRLAAGPIPLATGDLVAAEHAVAMLIAHATRYNTPYWNIAARCLEGELLIRRGASADGVALLSDALGSCEKTGWAVCYPTYQGVLAEGLAGLGRLAEALAAVEKALAMADRGGERWFFSELMRIKGEVLLEKGGNRAEALAEECFAGALEVARQQGALFWELRAAMGLARLRVREGRPDDARQILAPVYDRFTEGFRTADLRAARAMLDTLPLV